MTTFPQNANHRGFIWKNISNCYTISFIMSKSDQIYFKNLSVFTHHKIFEVCLTIFSRLEVFCKKGVLKNLAKLTGKHLCWSLFFNKVAGLRLATLLKKRLQHWCFPVNFAKFLRTPFFIEYLRYFSTLYVKGLTILERTLKTIILMRSIR